MIKCARVDGEGFFVQDVWLEQPSDDPELVYAKIPSGLYFPKWDGSEWIEGLSQAEIDAIQNAPREFSELEKIQKDHSDLVLELIMNGVL